jgi:methylamine dehydrogenase accessory protein MauD
MTPGLVAILSLQWAVIIGLALVVVALVRQVGVIHQRIAPAGALMISQGVKPGEPAPELRLRTVDDEAIAVGGIEPGGRSTLLMFIAPDCPVCATLLSALKSVAADEKAWLKVVFASDGDAARHRAFRTEKGLQGYPYVVSMELGLTYRIGKLPYAVLLDEQGILVSQGLTNSREHVESLFEARRLKAASIQDYLANQGHPPKAPVSIVQ